MKRKHQKGIKWLPKLGMTDDPVIRSRTDKAASVLSQFIYMLPMTGDKEYDNDWFRFFTAESQKVAHMKKRMIGKYLNGVFINRWMHHYDRWLRNRKFKDDPRYLINVSRVIDEMAVCPKALSSMFYKGLITILNHYADTKPIKHDKFSFEYWKDIRGYMILIMRVVASDQRNKIHQMAAKEKNNGEKERDEAIDQQ